MAEMKIHANKVKELAAMAFKQIEAEREREHEAAIAELAKENRVFSWWSGSKLAPLTPEQAVDLYNRRRPFVDDFMLPSGREETNRPFDKRKLKVESLVSLASKSLAYSDGFITLNEADAKVLIPSEILIDG